MKKLFVLLIILGILGMVFLFPWSAAEVQANDSMRTNERKYFTSYIVERELSNAYTNVVVNGDSVVEALWKSSLVSDREIMRKLKEFGFCDEDGNLIRDYPIQAMEMIETKLREQSGGEK